MTRSHFRSVPKGVSSVPSLKRPQQEAPWSRAGARTRLTIRAARSGCRPGARLTRQFVTRRIGRAVGSSG